MDNKQFVEKLSQLRPSSTFVSLLGYRNAASEIADYSIVFHIDYENALRHSLSILEEYNPIDSLTAQAKQDLLVSLKSSLKKSQAGTLDLNDGYERFFNDDGELIKGIKLHSKTNILHLYGLVAHKRVLIPGIYKDRVSSELAVAKNKLRAMTPVGKFRQFKIESDYVDSISVERLALLPPFNG